jgi:FAD/FMN-containing dehydrogenase/Fe-S oxidoreductase
MQLSTLFDTFAFSKYQKYMHSFDSLLKHFEGEIHLSDQFRFMYATDASEYREIPLGVAYPKNKKDIELLIFWAKENQIALIPRAGGTSLAGQVVGSGLVVDISKYFNAITDLDLQAKTVWVEAGVVRDDVNTFLESKSLFFAPETSTSNRACIGGMFGNNSCGSNSLIYGSTRSHILEAKGFLSDGSFVHFKSLSNSEFEEKMKANSLESHIYKSIFQILSPKEVQQEIQYQFPEIQISRRNSGYAIDELIQTKPFNSSNSQIQDFNFCKLLAGSEGTLAFITDIKIQLVPNSPTVKAVIGVHCDSVSDVLKGNLIALHFQPSAVELIDNQIIQLSLLNHSQKENISVIRLEPQHPEIHILAIEFSESNHEMLAQKCDECITALQNSHIGYHFPILSGKDLNKIWQIRKAGLGIMSNMKGDAKPKSFVEDSVVAPEHLPSYFEEFSSICHQKGIQLVAYGHIATGEIHKKPILDFHNPEHFKLFHILAFADAQLVKQYKGSLSGEHGDGRLRGEFLPFLLGEKNYEILKQIKVLFDPQQIFNPGKIVNTPQMDQFLRTMPNHQIPKINSYFDFPETDGFVNALNKCCNSGDCRKSVLQGGTMCPSFQARKEEYFSTRARANVLREMILNTVSLNPYKTLFQNNTDPSIHYSDEEIYEILSWCLACKACKAECPSGVDMTKLRAEFLQHYYDRHGIPLRSLIIGHYPLMNELGSYFSHLYHFTVTHQWSASILKKMLGFAEKRSLPIIHKKSLMRWQHSRKDKKTNSLSKVYLFPDEFTNRNDVEIGKKAVLLLEKLGFEVLMIKSTFSGRTYLSKGMLKRAKKCAEKNIRLYRNLINQNTPLIGIEPSAILSFRDEYPDLLKGEYQKDALKMAPHCLLIDEFIMHQFENGTIKMNHFTDQKKEIIFHAHCYQKALSDKTISVKMMQIPKNYSVTLLEDGCCGMAGSFGFEKEHFDISQKIGELTLFPAIRNKKESEIVAACGTSCRHQMKDGTGIHSYHPIEILFDALI